MNQSKTELPTLKKKRDAAKRGQVLKSKDITTTINLVVVMSYLFYFFNGLDETLHFLLTTLPTVNDINHHAWLRTLMMVLVQPTLVLLVVTLVSSIVPSLLQSRFVIATQALKIDFKRMDPIAGFKRIFSVRTLFNTLKSLLYVAAVACVSWLGYHEVIHSLLTGVNATSMKSIIALCERVFLSTLLAVLITCGLIAILDFLLEYFHYIKELMMTRQEVKKEHTEQNGKPEIKSKRRELHQEILNEDIKKNVRDSQVLLANPTHIAIGIYFNLSLSPYPFISLVQSGAAAQAVLKYASEIGKPIYRDKKLVREMYKTVKPYTFLHWKWFDALLTALRWLEEVENQYISLDGGDHEQDKPQLE
ncbi:EscU/YscU/HrcU family type III secretion system export apparatus switch protein [Pantoea cypripedii]|uniref:EscU/YscU/HrcU family type III secretion system export apparatus switch protein n=1 Tax=Pantoea cypripedii TaxID=55209 RepID=UPI002FCBD2A9